MKVLAALLTLATACTLYDADDTTGNDAVDVDAGMQIDAGRPSMVGTWSVETACLTQPQCSTGWSGITRARIDERPGRVEIHLVGGESLELVHYGQRGELDYCASVPDGEDQGVARGGYVLCLQQTAGTLMNAEVEWAGGSRWVVQMTRL